MQMTIQIDEDYKKLCYIQSIKPGKLNICLILICILLSILTLLIPIILYWKWQKFKNFIHRLIFTEVEADSEDINHYLIVDSKRFQGKARSILYRNSIITPYLIQKQNDRYLNSRLDNISHLEQTCKYIQHRNLKYVIKNNILYSLKYKINKNLFDYFEQGLTSKQIQQSINIYGKASSLLISFYHIFIKMLHHKHLKLVFMLLAVKKIIFGFLSQSKQTQTKQQTNQILVSITILIELVIAWLMMLGISIFGAKQHNRIHNKIQNQVTYQVIRNGQNKEVKKLNDLCVGDIVMPEVGKIIYFKGILAIGQEQKNYTPYMILNQKLYNRQDKPIRKSPIHSHLAQIQESNIITAGSQIMSMGLKKDKILTTTNNQQATQKSGLINKTNQKQKQLEITNVVGQQPKQGKFFIIVTDNNYIQRFYQSFRETRYFDNFQSIRNNYDFQQIVFHCIFLVLALIATFVVVTDEKTHEHWINLLLSNLVLCFPFNLALFCNFSQILSIIRLKGKDISVINPVIQQAGMINNLVIELSTFETLQFKGFIKKQRCTQLSQPQRFEGRMSIFDIFKRARQDSIFTFLGWAGAINLPYFNKEPIYKQIFQRFQFEQKQESDYYGDQQDRHRRIVNHQTQAIKIDWKLLQRFPISQMLCQTVVIKNCQTTRLQNTFFAISQVDYTNDDCLDYFDQLMDQHGTDQYKDIMRRLLIQGKKIKYICLKKINLRQQNQIPDKFYRQHIQRKLNFGGLLIFDQWPTHENMKNLIELDLIQLDNDDSGLNVTIFSTKQQNSLVGYDHILRKAKIFCEMQSVARAQQSYMSFADFDGVFHVGHGILDQGCLLLSDVSVNKISESYGQADFHIAQPHSVLSIIYEGIWSLYNTTITVVCLVLFNFSKIIGQLVLFEGNPINKIQPSPLSSHIDRLFLVDFGALLIPLFLLNLYQPTSKLVKKDHRNFFRVQLMFHVFISILGLLVLYTIEFLDHGFQGTCQIYQVTLKERNLMSLRQNHHLSPVNNDIHPCEGIINFITLSYAFLVIILIDRESVERKPKNIFFGAINKLYMFLMWLGSIFYFHIPAKNIFRAAMVLLVLTVLVYLPQLVKKQFLANQNNQKEESIRESILSAGSERADRQRRLNNSRIST